MEQYVGLDVSLKQTAICIVDRTGKIEREGVVASDPETIAAFVKSHAPLVVRIGLETGATATWLWTELNKEYLIRFVTRGIAVSAFADPEKESRLRAKWRCCPTGEYSPREQGRLDHAT